MIAVDHTLAKLVSDLKRIHSQVPFAASRALNVTARAVQDFELSKELPGGLKLRGNWARKGTRFGVNVNFARKDNLQSEVFSRAPWLDMQEWGGTKVGKHKILMMPVLGGARPSELAPYNKRLKPSGLKFMRRKGGAVIAGPNGVFISVDRYHSIFKVVGKGRGPLRVGALRRMWSFTDKSARVRKRISFEAHGGKMGVEMIPVQFLKEYEDAMNFDWR